MTELSERLERWDVQRDGPPSEEFVLEAGDRLAVPKGTPHSAAVVGDEPVVALDAVRR